MVCGVGMMNFILKLIGALSVVFLVGYFAFELCGYKFYFISFAYGTLAAVSGFVAGWAGDT